LSILSSIEKFSLIFVIESASKALITVSVKPNYKRTMKEKLFTKSAFKVALTCPTQLYYYRNHEYANQNLEDEFLQSLAEGGFQVGELAKVYYGIDSAHDIKSLDYDESLRQTKSLFDGSTYVNIAEAAFRWDNCFVRVDILEKVGSTINIIEVKAKSWDERQDHFMGKKDPQSVDGGIREYVYDAAFQKYVVANALKEQYPGQHFMVHAYLMMADKTAVADVDGINQYFRIVKHGNRTEAVREPGAENLASAAHILKAYKEVDGVCDSIIAGLTAEQPALMNATFKEFVDQMSHIYCDNRKVDTPINAGCKKCPFFVPDGDTSGSLDGRHECFAGAGHFQETDFSRPMVFELNGSGCSIKNIMGQGKMFIDQVDDLGIKKETVGNGFLSLQDRNWLQIGMATNHEGTLRRFRHNIHDGAYIDIAGLRREMSSWTYPLHMIDFETSRVALPFYKGLHPYEQIAFQFSHHVIDMNSDGTYSIRHESSEPDRQELIDFILTITRHRDPDKRSDYIHGDRDMVDLCKIVSDYYFHPSMKGRTSIKVSLPAVLNSSQFLQQKYSQPIYGSLIPSLNIPASEPIAWIKMMDDGKTVENPYHLLPSVASYLDLSEDQIEREPDYYDMTIAHGGAALTAYSKLQFSDTNQSDALSKALLRYCELDTMAMVFIWEYFYNMIKNN